MDAILNVKTGKRRYAVPVGEIIMMEKDKRRIIVHTAGEEIVFYGKFDDVMPLLDERFVCPHRSYIINMDHISRLGETEIVLDSDNRVNLGRMCFARMLKSYDEYVMNSGNEYVSKRLANQKRV